MRYVGIMPRAWKRSCRAPTGLELYWFMLLYSLAGSQEPGEAK